VTLHLQRLIYDLHLVVPSGAWATDYSGSDWQCFRACDQQQFMGRHSSVSYSSV